MGGRVVKRLTDYLAEHGNGGVCVDFKYGDEIALSAIPLVSCGYKKLSKLGRDTVTAHDACGGSRNKARGKGA